MKSTTLNAALLGAITLTAGTATVVLASPSDTRPAAPSLAAAFRTSGVPARDELHLLRASRFRPPTRKTAPVPPKVVALTHSPARIVHLSAQPGAVSFTNQEMRVRSCESGPNGYATDGRAYDYNYTEENSSSTASGAWQFVDGTWNDFMGYSHASLAPRSVQDLKARRYIDANGLSAWDASRSCWSA